MKKRFVSIILSGLLFLTACSPVSLQQMADATASKMAGDFYATQTGLAYPTYLQQMVNATTTAMAESFYATQTALANQATAIPIPFTTAIATFPSSSQAVVNIESLSVRSGPGTVYPVQAYVVRGDKLTILGQAYKCSWLKVRTTDGQTGWVSATYLVYSLACGEIALAPIPPVPTQVAQATLTKGPSGGSCDATSFITIINNTGGNLSVDLSGPANYHVGLGPGGNTTISVCPGSYYWSASTDGCGGGGSGSGNIDSGGTLTLSCG
jgi:uncharacterized protein YraI